MPYAFEDLERELAGRAVKAGSEKILDVFKMFGAVMKNYAHRAEVRKEISARIPIPNNPGTELCIYLQQPLSRMTVFHEGEYKEAERSQLKLPSAFVHIWLEDIENKRFIGQSVIPASLGFSKLDLESFKLSSPEVFDEAIALIKDLIAVI